MLKLSENKPKFSIPRKDINQLKTDQSRALVNMLVIRRPFELMCSYSFSLPKNGSLDCVLKRNKQFEQVAGTSGDCTLLSLDYLCLILKVSFLLCNISFKKRMRFYIKKKLFISLFIKINSLKLGFHEFCLISFDDD